MPDTDLILRIAVPTPLDSLFDYLAPKGVAATNLQPGMRVLIPFGRRQLVGVLIEVSRTTDIERSKLKAAKTILDTKPTLDSALLAMVKWAARYYHHPIGDAVATALPVLLRKTEFKPRLTAWWYLTETGRAVDLDTLKRAPRQASAIARLQASDGGLSTQACDTPLSVLRALQEKGLIIKGQAPANVMQEQARYSTQSFSLNNDQQLACDQVVLSLNHFETFLLEGVTGSGKTAVYLQIIDRVIANKKQALILVPEIGLTPQLVQRFEAHLNVPVAVMHSGMNDSQRLNAWTDAKAGRARVIIGTRSAIFSGMPELGLIVVDEEHDTSLKQQEGFRYSARDLAIWRAHQMGIPIILGSATPALESLHNVQLGRYTHLSLPERAGNAQMPTMHLLDMRNLKMEGMLSESLLGQMKTHLDTGGQVLVFLNRRGFSPVMLCHDCGWTAHCQRCDAHMTYHHQHQQLRCHHCDHQQPVPVHCNACGSSELIALGHGTERIETQLQSCFPDREILRIDRDTTSRKGSLHAALEKAQSGQSDILLGTQMLAKGHHFPNVTLVAIIDADQGLFGSDFRSSERMAQQIVQVAGRSGRGDTPGEVIIQTHQPEHPLLLQLVSHGYSAFAKTALEERHLTQLPPVTHMAILRAESPQAESPLQFLEQAKQSAAPIINENTQLWGPVPAPMERRAGRYRAQLIIQSIDRKSIQVLLKRWIPLLGRNKQTKVRWSIDVDPQDML